MRLNDEQKKIVLKNMRLVYYIVGKLGVSNEEYDDAISEGLIGLQKAVATFDKTKKIAFATYATKCIKNEIFMYFRKQKKHIDHLFLEDSILVNDQGDEMTWYNIIPDSKIDLEDRIEQRQDVTRVVNIILNLLKPRERLIMLYKISGVTQAYVSKRLFFAQSYISRLEKKALKKVIYYFENQKEIKEVFSMSIEGNSYKVTFASKDIKQFNKIFAMLLQNITTTETLPDFKVTCNKERIVVQIPAHPEAFRFVAQIIQEMDDFSMSYVSDKNGSLNEKDEECNENQMPEEPQESIQMQENADAKIEEVKENESSVKDENESKNEPTELTGVTNSDDATPKKSENTASERKSEIKGDITKGKKDKCKKVREYILTLDSFTTKDVREHFPELSRGDIGNALYLAKSKVIITSVEGKFGSYTVNKN